MQVAAIEAGGTKFNLAIGRPGEAPLWETRLPTEDPSLTLPAVVRAFKDARSLGLDFGALGIGSFGPVDLDPSSPHWGSVTDTPKPGWAGTDMARTLGDALGVPVAFDTDVNTAALAEARLGAARGLDPVVYLTIGTGIGGGAVINGRLLHGLVHPEMGHALVKRHPKDTYGGKCPFHGDCIEGLAAGPAVEARWRTRGEALPPDHAAWDMEAWYVAQLVLNLQMTLSPRAVILGGGVMDVPGIRDRVRAHATALGANYLVRPRSQEDWAGVILAPSLDKPGLQGALLLAMDLLGPRD